MYHPLDPCWRVYVSCFTQGKSDSLLPLPQSGPIYHKSRFRGDTRIKLQVKNNLRWLDTRRERWSPHNLPPWRWQKSERSPLTLTKLSELCTGAIRRYTSIICRLLFIILQLFAFSTNVFNGHQLLFRYKNMQRKKKSWSSLLNKTLLLVPEKTGDVFDGLICFLL